MKKCIFFAALLMSSYVINGMESDSPSRSASRDGIGERSEGDVSLSRESLKPLSLQRNNNSQKLKKVDERQSTFCERMGHIVVAGCVIMLLTYKYNLCPFVSGNY